MKSKKLKQSVWWKIRAFFYFLSWKKITFRFISAYKFSNSFDRQYWIEKNMSPKKAVNQKLSERAKIYLHTGWLFPF
ncbi:MAG: hypothetical protein EOM59_22320 [Clostridia bacterium]|nr:hypothetical protein [Clostridia bacterium]